MTWRKQDIFKFGVSTVLILLTLALFLPFYSEILLAAVFALAIEPSLGRWLKARHLRWKTSVAGVLGGMFLLIAGPFSLLGYRAYLYVMMISKTGYQNTEMFQKLVVFRDQLLVYVNESLKRFHLDNQIDLSGMSEDGLKGLGAFAVDMSTKVLYHIPSVLLSVFVFNLALYFFLVEAKAIKDSFIKTRFLTQDEANQLVVILQKSSFSTVVTSLSLGGLSSLMVALGAVIMHAGDFDVIFSITFFCSFIPIIGAGPVALALGLYKLVIGSVGATLGFVLIAVAIGFVDNGLRPYIISSSGEDDLHPVVSLLALIGALLIFGMPGIFLGPVIASASVRILGVFYPVPASPNSTAIASSTVKTEP